MNQKLLNQDGELLSLDQLEQVLQAIVEEFGYTDVKVLVMDEALYEVSEAVSE